MPVSFLHHKTNDGIYLKNSKNKRVKPSKWSKIYKYANHNKNYNKISVFILTYTFLIAMTSYFLLKND